MNRYQALRTYLNLHAPVKGFTVLGLGEETRDLCSRLQSDLGAHWVLLHLWPTPQEIREQDHYDVVLVPAVLHKHKNWYEYLEAIINVADIAIVETANLALKSGAPELAYARGLQAELRKTGEALGSQVLSPWVANVWAINRTLVRGEEAQVAMLSEILRGFNANVEPEHFHVSEEALEGIAGGLVSALKFHGYTLHYDPAITAANLNQAVIAAPVPQQVDTYEDNIFQPGPLQERPITYAPEARVMPKYGWNPENT